MIRSVDRAVPVLIGLAAALALSLVAGILVGAVAIAPGDIVAALVGGGDGPPAVIVRELRLPRVLAAALVGGALAVAGALLQGLLRNPLADPYVTGTSAGGALGAIAAIAVLGPSSGALVPAFAFAGALAAVAIVWHLARLGGRTTVLAVLLAGVALSAFAGSLITILLVANDRLSLRLRAVLDVLVGGVSVRDQPELAAAALVVAAGVVGALAIAPRIDAYAFGEETAAALGVDTRSTTVLILTLTALLAGAAVALAGLVGFVGLVVPHALRAVIGAAHRRLVAASFLAGAAALVLADLGARSVLAPAELPVGAVTGLVGGPFFLSILARSRRTAA